MNFHIITLFPDSFESYLNSSILKRAIEDKKIKVKFYDPKDYSEKRKGKKESVTTLKLRGVRRVDDKPYGGGPGMVVRALPVIKAIAKAIPRRCSGQASLKCKTKIIFFSPSGKKFDTPLAQKYAKSCKDIIFVCGRYEGVDARVKKVFKMDEISIGDFVLTGGELPAMVLMDSISRQIKGVLGDIASLEESRIASSDVYTRPETFKYKGKNYAVPDVLLSGNHKEIEKWREKGEC